MQYWQRFWRYDWKSSSWEVSRLVGVSKTIALTEFAALFIVILFAPILLAFSMLPILGVFLNGTSSIIYGTVPEVTKQKNTLGLLASFIHLVRFVVSWGH